MKIERHYLYNDFTTTMEESLLDQLPKNSWRIDKKLKFTRQYESFSSIENELEYINTLILKLAEIRVEERKRPNSKTDSNYWLKKSLFQSIIISYARCFNYTKGTGRVSINKDFIKKEFPEHPNISIENTLKFHDLLMDIRNKYIGHADNSGLEKTIGFIKFSYDGKTLNSELNYLTASIYSFDENQITNLIILSAWLLKKVRRKLKVLSDKIINELTEEELRKIGLSTLKFTIKN